MRDLFFELDCSIVVGLATPLEDRRSIVPGAVPESPANVGGASGTGAKFSNFNVDQWFWLKVIFSYIQQHVESFVFSHTP